MFHYAVLHSVTQILTDSCSGHAIQVPPRFRGHRAHMCECPHIAQENTHVHTTCMYTYTLQHYLLCQITSFVSLSSHPHLHSVCGFDEAVRGRQTQESEVTSCGAWRMGMRVAAWECPASGSPVTAPMSSPGKAPESRFCFALVMHLESRWQQRIFHINV